MGQKYNFALNMYHFLDQNKTYSHEANTVQMQCM